jgi:hypothetical protein
MTIPQSFLDEINAAVNKQHNLWSQTPDMDSNEPELDVYITHVLPNEFKLQANVYTFSPQLETKCAVHIMSQGKNPAQSMSVYFYQFPATLEDFRREIKERTTGENEQLIENARRFLDRGQAELNAIRQLCDLPEMQPCVLLDRM